MTDKIIPQIATESLVAEGTRLLNLSLSLLNDIKNNPNLILGEEDKAKIIAETNDIIFNTQGIDKQTTVLNGERIKLANQETVIAVVGTMKAGKSTTINAIVGTEVLPNRNRPMTALPTLIKHTEGFKEPVLTIENIIPINTLVATLNNVLNEQGDSVLEGKLEIDSDIESLVNRIYSQGFYKRSYEGSHAIFEFLKELNDLVRVSKALDVPFPFEEYATIDKIPYIEVEFCRLANNSDGNGQLTLLDTPGPNEEGQEHLRVMLEDQLSKCSAVLVVMDYSQLKSTSDAEVREVVLGVGSDIPVYALVNKFDQKDKNSDGFEDVKRIVSSTLTKGAIPEDKVYPVSSKLAYLGNSALREISLNGKLPDYREHGWVVDFAEEAFGRRWKDSQLENIEEVLESTKFILDDSYFNLPMENIIVKSYRNASFMAVESAINKLIVITDQLSPYFQLLKQGVDIDITVLNRRSKELLSDLNTLLETQTILEQTINDELEGMHSAVTEFTENSTKAMNKDIEKYFKDGRDNEFDRLNELVEREKNLRNKKIVPIIKTIKGKIYSRINSNSNTANGYLTSGKKKVDFDPGQTTIAYDTSERAEELLSNINASIENMFGSRQEIIIADLTALVQELEVKVTETISDSINPIRDKILADLKNDGFDVDFKFPDFNGNYLKFDVNDIFERSIVVKDKVVSGRRRVDNAWGVVCDWFGTEDWGWEEYSDVRKQYVVDLKKLKKTAQTNIKSFSKTLDDNIKYQIVGPVKSSLNQFISEFSFMLKAIQLNLEKSVTIQMGEEKTINEIKMALIEKIEINDQIKVDIADLADENLKAKSKLFD